MKYHALFVIFEKAAKFEICLLLQIIGGALMVKTSALISLNIILFGFWFNVPVNSYGHVETVKSPNHTFFLGKLRLSSQPVLCAHTFPCN